VHDENAVLGMLKTRFVQLTDVWAYSPNADRARWNGNYEKINGETRPVDRGASFDLRIIDGNDLKLTTESVGIYAIRDNISVIYIGLTERNIKQRFDAHVSKLTAVNKWHHPERWRNYVSERLQREGNEFECLDEFEIGFYDLSKFQPFLEEDTIAQQVDDMEALVFYGLCVTNPKERFLNTESSVGTRENRKKWFAVFS
jgi:hypothetical protein